MKDLLKNNSEFYAEIWDSISAFVKIGAMEDEKFSELAQNSIIFETKLGLDSVKEKEIENKFLIKFNDKFYTTLENYANRNKSSDDNKILYCTDEISQSNALNLWLSNNREVIKADPLIDAQFIPWLESQNEKYKFQRVDSEINDDLEKDSPEIVDKDGKSNTDNIKEIITNALNNEKVTVKVQSLKNNNAPPALILLPEQMRRINDMGAYMEQKIPGLPEYHVLLVNKDHPLINGLIKFSDKKIILNENDSDEISLTGRIANHIYAMAKLTVGGLDQKQIVDLQLNNAELLTELLNPN